MYAASQGFQNPECYARALGGCCVEISGEHYVSRSTLELIYGRHGAKSKKVLVRNLAFQERDVLQSFGIGNLTSKILCKTHNNLLSPFDDVGKAMFSSMDSLNEAALNPQLPAGELRVDGDGLERWMLKTLCGGLYSGNLPVPPGASKRGICPPTGWLEILFNGVKFPDGLGLYYVRRRPGETITADQFVFKIEPLMVTEGQVVMGFMVWFFGFQFVLLTARLTPGVTTMFDDALYRPGGFQEVGSGARIQFDWKDGPQSADVMVKSEAAGGMI